MWGGGAHLDKRLPAEGGAKEDPERSQEVATTDAAEVKQRIGPGSQQEDAPEAVPVHGTVRRLSMMSEKAGIETQEYEIEPSIVSRACAEPGYSRSCC